jgi:hypothetical protein
MTGLNAAPHGLTEEEIYKAIIQLHIAEYEAVNTRATYRIILQAGLLSLIPVFLTLGVQVYKSDVIIKPVAIWGTVLSLHIVGYVWAQTLADHYDAVKYVECFLRSRIGELGIKENMFWGYEPHLTWKRPMSSSSWTYPVPVIGIFVFIITCIYRYKQGLSLWDVPLALLTLVALFFLWLISMRAKKMLNEWSKHHRALGWDFKKVCNNVEGPQV